jgi:hypothetical protein
MVPATSHKTQRISLGVWGGDHIQIDVARASATIEYDCAQGTINGPLTIDRTGKFNLSGTHVRERGGPVRQDEKRPGLPARYTGSIEGNKMTLTVVLTDSNEELGTFKLVRGNAGRVRKCK